MKLSKLEKVDLREVWKYEAINFTNWLSEFENLESLSDEIGNCQIRSEQVELKIYIYRT